MKKFIKFILKYIEKIYPEITYEQCYVKMRNEGHAFNGKCSGRFNVKNESVEYFNHDCIGCPYLDYSNNNVINHCNNCFGASNNDCKKCKYFG